MKAYLALVILAVLIVSGCKSKQEKETLWGVYQEPVKPGVLPAGTGASELQTLWKKNIGGGPSIGYAILKPAYFEDSVYVANRGGEIFRFDSITGSMQWKQNLGTEVFAGIGVNDGLAVVAHDNGDVTGVDTSDGSINWSTSIKRQISAIPVIGKGRVLIRTADGLVMGLDSRTGEIVWQIEKATPGLSMHGDSTPVITGDAVLVGLSNGNLIANNVINGRDYWETEISFVRGQNELERLTDSDTTPIVQGTTVYTATYQGNVVALQLQNASIIWRTKVSTRLPMAISNKQLFVTAEYGEVVAIDATDGNILWEQKSLRGHGVSQPVVLDNRVVVGDSNGKIHTLDRNTGDFIESKKLVSGSIVGVMAGNEQFTIFSSEGNISALSF
jgi:outer membrane protein assembly factor BamB